MSKKLAYLLSFILFSGIAYASIDFSFSEKSYNLGDKIEAFAKISSENEVEGIFTARMVCDDYSLTYFSKPIKLEGKGQTETMALPTIPAISEMLGKCRIEGKIKSYAGIEIEKGISGSFKIIDKLNILAVSDKNASSPGEEVRLSIEVTALSGTSREANLVINFNEADLIYDKNDSFEITLTIPGNTKPGNKYITLFAEDDFGNSGEEMIGIYVKPVPGSIVNEFEQAEFRTGETISIKPSLFDRNGNLINGTVNVRLLNPKNKEIFHKTIESYGEAGYLFTQNDAPGTYKVISEIKNISKEDTITVLETKEFESHLEGEIIKITNIGNVLYNDKITIIIKSNDKKYVIEDKVRIRPGESAEIDLSTKVPADTYEITYPATSLESETAEDILITDNRNIIRKLGMGLKSITGAYTGSGMVSSKPYIAPLLLIIIIIGVFLFYSRDKIRNMLKKE